MSFVLLRVSHTSVNSFIIIIIIIYSNLGTSSFLKRKDCHWNKSIFSTNDLRVRFFSFINDLSLFLCFDQFCYLYLVIESDKYRREMLENNETFLTNLEHQKSGVLGIPNFEAAVPQGF